MRSFLQISRGSSTPAWCVEHQPPVAPARSFAHKALAQFPDGFAPQYRDIADQARRAFPWDTELHFALGVDRTKIMHVWPKRNLILVIDAELKDGGTVELVDYKVVSLPDDPTPLHPT